jgi:NAD-dependent deacetylase
VSAIDDFKSALKEAHHVAALSGAGISAESGVPTFRGEEGLWRNHSPEKLATAGAFFKDPRLVWEWYDWLRGVMHKAEPNPGHCALARFEQECAASDGAKTFTLITQNIDGLDDRAGCRNIAKLHGDIWMLRCVDCGHDARNTDAHIEPLPPRCKCGGLLRPGIVWFGEALPEAEWDRGMAAASQADIFMVIGTSATVYPAAGLASVARHAGAKLAVINREPTPVDEMADWVFQGPSGEVLPKLL